MKRRKKKALFSLFDQERSIFFAQQLIRSGWEIIATQETVKLLKGKGIKIKNISEYLGVRERYPFPPTLHPKIELALTGDLADSIDLVYITTYPKSRGNDVGGNTILALAAKGSRIVVSNKEDMAEVVGQLMKINNKISHDLRMKLIDKANDKICRHYLSLIENLKDVSPVRITPLLHGENPYQAPAELFQKGNDDPLALGNFHRVSGDTPCFTNMADLDSVLRILCLAAEAFQRHYSKIPYMVICAKHGNPCGFSVNWESKELAIDNALWGNPQAIWGGEVITNFVINGGLAERLYSSYKRKSLLGDSRWMLHVIAAPGFSKDSIELLRKNRIRKLFKNSNLRRPFIDDESWALRESRGSFIRQPPNNYILDLNSSSIDFDFPNVNIIDSIIIAWATAWFSGHGGNEVAIAKNRKLLTAAGGPSTVISCSTAILRAREGRHSLKNSVFAADSFFPFSDAPRKLIKVGCTFGIVPDGGKNAELVKNYFKRHKAKVFYLPEQFRGFCKH